MARRDRRAAAKAAPRNLKASMTYRVDREKTTASPDPVGILLLHLDEGLRAMDEAGVDILEHVVVTIGRHPEVPDDVTIELKSDTLRPALALKIDAD